MKTKKPGDFIGYSNSGIHDAVQNALEEAGDPTRFKIIETSCRHDEDDERHYHAMVATLDE